MKLRDRFRQWVGAASSITLGCETTRLNERCDSINHHLSVTMTRAASMREDCDDLRSQMETAANFAAHTTAQLEALTLKFQEVADKLELPAQSMTLLFNWVSDLRKRMENLEKSSVRLASYLPKAAKRTAKKAK